MLKTPRRQICSRRNSASPARNRWRFISASVYPAGIAVLLLRFSNGTLPLTDSSARKDFFMSNQIGDRYTCSDPNCGCEVAIEGPCNADAASTRPGSGSSESDATAFHGATRSSGDENISTVGDFDSRGASGEGLYGTTGSGRSAATPDAPLDSGLGSGWRAIIIAASHFEPSRLCNLPAPTHLALRRA